MGESKKHASYGLESIYFIDQNNGWCVGDTGTILQTSNGGDVWNDYSLLGELKNLNSVYFLTTTTGITVGTGGIILRTTDGGVDWEDVGKDSNRNRYTKLILHSVHFADQLHGIAVGDSGTILKTTDGGIHWQKLVSGITTRLNCVRMLDTLNIWVVDSLTSTVTNNLKSTNGGATWTRLPKIGNAELKSIYFVDQNTGFVSGVGGSIYKTVNGGGSWTQLGSQVTQNLDGVYFTNSSNGWAAGGSLLTTIGNNVVPGGGVILKTSDGGTTWTLVPHGNINVGVIDDDKTFVFLGLPLHRLNGDGANVKNFLQYVLFNEFGF